MKVLLIACFLVTLAVGSVWAQAGAISIFGDPSGTNCDLKDKTPGLTPYYIVHVYTSGATACQYSAPKPACMTAMWLSDTNMFPVSLGNSQTGMSVGYGSCRVGPIHVQTISFFTMGTTPACCLYWVCPDPRSPSGRIEVADCGFDLTYGTGGAGIVNGTPACTCGCASLACVEALYKASSQCFGVPVEDATWGRIKDAYSE